jgi:hypothetical protein
MIEPLGDDESENVDRFLVEVIENGCVWGLEGPEGWALCASETRKDTHVMPFWSQQQFALAHCQEDWQGYRPVAIELEEFLEDWLTGMHQDVVLAGLNWDAELEGREMEPLDLLEEFDQELAG